MTTRHLGTRIQEHLHSKNPKSAIRDHIELCRSCQGKQLDVNNFEVKQLDVNNFEVIRTCNSEYETKLQETLLIKIQSSTQ